MIGNNLKSISILLLEDTNKDVLLITEMLNQLGIKNITHVKSYKKAVEIFRKQPFDLLLIDIYLGKNQRRGDDFVRSIRKQNNHIPVIYLTNAYETKIYDEVKSTYPVCFLRKDLSLLSIYQAIELSTLQKANQINQYPPLSLTSENFFIKIGNIYKSVALKDVSYFKSMDKATYLCIEDRSYPVSISLKSLEEQLFRFNFIRIHRSYIVNLQKVDSFNRSSDSLTIKGTAIPIGSSYGKEFLDQLNLLS